MTTKPPADEVAPATAALLELLERERVSVELLPHSRTTTAASEAKALGIVPQTVAKTVVLEGEASKLRAVVPASMHVDLVKLAELAGTRVRQLTEDELAGEYPEFELGAVPPFGGPAGDRVVVDRHVTEMDQVVLEGGVHDASLRMAADDLVAVAHAEVADIARP